MLAVVAGDRAVSGFGLDGLAVGRHQHTGHQAEAAEALGDLIGLHVAVVVLAGPNELAAPLEGAGDHVVDQAVLILYAGGGELFLEALGIENLLEQVLEAPVVGLDDRVLGRKVQRPAAIERVVHARAGEVADRIVEVVHRHGDAAGLEVVNFAIDHLSVIAFPDEAQLAGAGHEEVGRAVLVAERVAADDDRVGPPGDQPRHVLDHDRLAEDRPAKNVADRPVGALVHLVKVEFLHPRLVRRDRGALHADAEFLDRVRRIDRDLITRLVALLDPQIVIFQVHVEVGEDQLLADPLPDDPRHLVAVDFDDRINNLDLRHGAPAVLGSGNSARPYGARRESASGPSRDAGRAMPERVPYDALMRKARLPAGLAQSVRMVGVARIELATPAMSTRCSTTELYAHTIGKGRERAPRQARPLALPAGAFKPLQRSSRSILEHAFDFENQVLEMEGLGENLALRQFAVRLERNGGESGDEHHLGARADLGTALGQLDAIHFGHDDIRQQQVEMLVLQQRQRRRSPVHRRYFVSGILERPRQVGAHRLVILGQQNTDHRLPSLVVEVPFTLGAVKNLARSHHCPALTQGARKGSKYT